VARLRDDLARHVALVLALGLWACGPGPAAPAATVGTWRLGAPMNERRAGHSVTLLADGRVLVAGGESELTEGDALASAELYDPVTEIWMPTGSMNTPRTWHGVAVLLGSGKVLVAGGCTGWKRDPASGYYWCLTSSSAELFDPVTGRWTATHEMEFARAGPFGGALGGALLPDGSVLVAGSWLPEDAWTHTGTATPPSEIYDPRGGRWGRVGDLAVASMGATMVPLLSGQVLLAGGSTNPAENCTKAALIADPLTWEWRRTGDLHSATWFNAMARLRDGRVLVAAGCRSLGYPCGGETREPYGEVYNPGTETWRTTGPMSFTRQHASAVVLPSGRVLVSGGNWVRAAGTPPVAPAGDVYDPATDSWTPTPPLPAFEIGGGSSVLLPTGEVLHAGGYVGDEPIGGGTAATQLFRE
jgi:hypothetical protein